MIDDDDVPEIIRGLNFQSLKSVLERDRDEMELEKTIENTIISRRSMDTKYFRQIMDGVVKKYYQMGNELVDENEYVKALDMYTKSIKISRRYLRKTAVDSYFNRAITFVILGYPKLALSDIVRIEKIPPVKPDIFYLKGEIYEFMGRYKMAKKMYMKSYLIDPSYDRVKNKIGKDILIL